MKRVLLRILPVLLIPATIFSPAPRAAKAALGAGQLIVKFRPENANQTAAVLSRDGESVKSMRSDRRFKLVKTASPAKLAALKQRLQKDPNVEYVEENQEASALMTPNDPLYLSGRQWNFAQVKAPSAWDIASAPGAGVTVAVLDTGIAYEDFAGYHRIPDMAGTTFVPGYDFINDDTHPNDDNGHGTHVAGTVAQTTNNAYGASGLAFGARLMPVKVLNENGYGTAFDIAQGIRWAADNGAKVINLSLGIGAPSPTVEDAVLYARNDKGVTVVAAAGNSAGEGDYTGGLLYPAAYSSVISVGATGMGKQRASYSQFGSDLDLVAPGGDIDQDLNGDHQADGILQETIGLGLPGMPGNPMVHGFYLLSGTSQAAPHVAAAAAMLISKGIAGPDAVRQALTRTAQDLGTVGLDKYYGYGLLDVVAALNYKAFSTVWYFAEGQIGNGFNTEILIVNPSDKIAQVRATFSKPGGARIIKHYSIGKTRRFAVNVGSISGLGATGVSLKLESTNGVGIYAERAMRFTYKGKKGGHASIGADTSSTAWYLAEGYTGGDFETQVLIYNPGDTVARARAVFTKPDGSKVARTYNIGPLGRKKIIVDEIGGLKAAEFATKVESLNGVGVVAERSMYFNYNGKDGGHNTNGITVPSSRWFFAEGTTRGAFDTWLLIQNPSNIKAAIKTTFSRSDGTQVTRSYSIKPGRRLTISVDSLSGLGDADVAAKVESTNGVKVVAERAVYFAQGGRRGGHVTVGAQKPSMTWYVPGGKTGLDNETWILIYNPKSAAAKLDIRFMRSDGANVSKAVTVAAKSRHSIAVDAVPGFGKTGVAAFLSATNGVPVVVERAVYYNDGGDVSLGYGL